MDYIDEEIKIALQQLERNPILFEDLEFLEQTAHKFKVADKEKEFLLWVENQLAKVQNLTGAHLCWLVEDFHGAAQKLTCFLKDVRQKEETFERYQKFFIENKDKFKLLLASFVGTCVAGTVEVNPQYAYLQRELIYIEDHLARKELIHFLELLINTHANRVITLRTKGRHARLKAHLDYYCHLARQLMRFYEKHCRPKVIELGFQILEGEPPFTWKETIATNKRRYRKNIGLCPPQNVLDCVFIMLTHLKSADDIARVAEITQEIDCIPLKNQVAKLLVQENVQRIHVTDIHRCKYSRATVRTLGLPPGIRILTNRNNIESISPDGKWIGTSWGLVRYQAGDDNSLDILQIPLGEPVIDFCSDPDGLFVATSKKLLRLDHPDETTPKLVHFDLKPLLPENSYRDISQILWWKDCLWLQKGDDVLCCNPISREAHFFLDVPGKLFIGIGRLWAARAVFDEATEEFVPLQCNYGKWQCIGATSQEVWADVYVDHQLRSRPAIVDLQTLKLRTLSITTDKQPQLNYISKIWAEDKKRVWLSTSAETLVYDRDKEELIQENRKFIEIKEDSHQGPATWAGSKEFFQIYWGSATQKKVPQLVLNGGGVCWQEICENKLLVGTSLELFEINPKTLTWKKLGHHHEELTGLLAKKIIFDNEKHRAYVCTDGGITILSLPKCDCIDRITISDGLTSNKVEDIAHIGEHLYVACGEIVVIDLTTGLIRSIAMTDGLECNQVKSLRAEGHRLHIFYGNVPNILRKYKIGKRCLPVGSDSSIVTFKSSILDTQMGVIFSGDEVLPTPPLVKEKIPYLGGSFLFQTTHSGKKFTGTTQGLIIAEENIDLKTLALQMDTEAVRPLLSLQQRQLAEVEAMDKINLVSAEQLKELLQHPNPYVRAEILASALSPILKGEVEYIPIIAEYISDPGYEVRATVVYLLSRCQDNSVVLILKKALDDSDFLIHGLAAQSLVQRGEEVPLSFFEEILRNGERYYGNFPYGAKSSTGLQVSPFQAVKALSANADGKIFELLVKYPLALYQYKMEEETLPNLGTSLCRHPEASDILLKAYRRENFQSDDLAQFVQAVFENAGKQMLPILHNVLTGKDSVILSNAARACGAIGDSSSILYLLEALNTESEISRTSIVWALGELKATQALTQLSKLYFDACDDEKLEEMIFPPSQQSHHEELGNCPADLLSSRKAFVDHEQVLKAIRKMAPVAQNFYRSLAKHEKYTARHEAAICLAKGEEMDKNLPVLKDLLQDDDVDIKISAAVSLVIIGEKISQSHILEWLTSENERTRSRIVSELTRIKKPYTLLFAIKPLNAILEHKNIPIYALRDAQKIANSLRKK